MSNNSMINFKELSKFQHLAGNIDGMPIVIMDYEKQRRTHKKKRINKKYAKRYGYIRCKLALETGRILMIDNKLYMNQETHELLHKSLR